MNNFPKYDRYKDSGVEWLGEIPAEWESDRVFSVFNERVERGNAHLPILNISIKNGVREERSEGDREQRTIADRTAYKRAAAGDIAYNTMRMWQGAVGDVPVDGLISPAYVVARPIKDANTRYYSYLFRSEQFQIETNRHSYGIVSDRNRLYWLGFKSIVIPIPPKPEQDRIVTFLDRKTSEIDSLIVKKQRQIELLDEQKAILINRAVTRGLNPNAKLKPSGIEWIGEIPEGWSTAPLYARCDVRLGKMLDERRFSGKHARPYLRNTDVQWFQINTENLPEMDFRPEERERYEVRKGDVLVCEGGEPGRAAIWERDAPCFFQKALHRIRPLKGDLPMFLLFLFRNAVTQSAFSGVDKATIAHLTGEQLRRFRFAFPPFPVQQSIVDHLLDLEAASNRAKSSITAQIESLKTLRSTLVAHAVTGRTKV